MPPSNRGIGNFVIVLNPTPTLGLMNLIIWNCRGFNRAEFRRNFRALIDWHKPPIVTLLETKTQSHQALLDEFYFSNMLGVVSGGNSGGIVILWDDTVLEFDEIITTNQEIYAMIKKLITHTTWLVSCIYASNFQNQRNILWDNLKNIKNNFSGGWLIGGDFNELLKILKKKEEGL